MRHRRKLSNMLVINQLMRDVTLSKAAKYTGVAIACHRNLKTLTCCPSQEALAMMTGTDPKTLRKGTCELVKQKYMVTVKARAQGAKWDHLQYYFLRDWAAQRMLVADADFQGDRMLFASAMGEINTVSREKTPTNSSVTG